MLNKYKVVYKGGQDEIIEKKSRFIATVAPVESEEEALAFIEAMKKKYWDARHNCFAYVIGERGQLARCSDDGEPGGTAGKPMLDVLLGEEIRNIVVVVTRYFGGTLLGTGGLVRAYSSSTQAGIRASVIITRIRGLKLNIKTDYNGLGKVQYILGQRGIKLIDSIYTENVELSVLLPLGEVKTVEAEITEGTNGRVKMEEGDECWFAQIDGEPQIVA